MKNAIFAVGEDFSFGNKDGTLPWGKPIKADMDFFKHITKTTGTVVMGYNTFKSLPKKLEGRQHIVIINPTTNEVDFPRTKDGSEPDMILPYSTLRFKLIDDALGRAGIKSYSVIGGTDLLKKAINSKILDNVFATVVSGEYNSDIKLNLEELGVVFNETSSLDNLTFYTGV